MVEVVIVNKSFTVAEKMLLRNLTVFLITRHLVCKPYKPGPESTGPATVVKRGIYIPSVFGGEIIVLILAEPLINTGQTEINRKRLFDEVLISYPTDIALQRKIARTLAALDEKIEANRAINDNLAA